MLKNKTQKEQFSDQFLKEYLSRGFGNMPKRELDVLIFYLLQQQKVFENKTNYEIARMLKTTPGKIKNLKYEAVLRFGEEDLTDDAYLRNRMKEYFQDPILKLEGKWLYMQIEDPVLLDTVKAALKEGGSFFDGSFNAEVVKISGDDYSRLMKTIIYEAHEQSLIKKALKNKKELSPTVFEEGMAALFKKAKDKGTDEGVEFLRKMTQKLLMSKVPELVEMISSLT
ncbi:hypothetical protein [Robertkochia sediminum]|uniref:hypothetical protein n=1 Tax=Robertkochia sediminum TaxID=2785326 RepID=UPI001931527D|nr:hypothetical protein [Robertkochia sediminum]MBL7471373.1 hypothetical protein [Robertkochia sediminum]